MSYPKLTVLLTAAALTIPSCNQKQTEHTELSNTLQLKRGDMTKILKDSITQGNGTITTRNDTITQQNNNNSTNNFEAKNNDTSEVNKDIYTPLSENNYNFTKGEFLERLLTVLAIFTIGGATGYLFGNNNKANKMISSNKSELVGHIIGILSNTKLRKEIKKIGQKITNKNTEFRKSKADKTDINYIKKYNKIQSLIDEFNEISEYIYMYYIPDEIIEETEKLIKRHSEFKTIYNEYSFELTQYRISVQNLKDRINSQKRKLNITKPVDKVIEDIKTGKIKYTETYKELFNLAEEYNSTETSNTKMQTLCDYLSEIEKTINPLFTLPQELAQEPTNSETE